ncbi:OLC1v1026900C1 [Oldenlandia corymbosa var. corymbosa]|uniref:OLC1v1026900C1 n=1 Tax=Oldenlandia corymbosa var. corymbosa TaxID=529605 RepID=A0AAV1CBE6_OLDCO|nr:OLC1v1026900C1 [Oldenlandia corymbosa var. corymbosa]
MNGEYDTLACSTGRFVWGKRQPYRGKLVILSYETTRAELMLVIVVKPTARIVRECGNSDRSTVTNGNQNWAFRANGVMGIVAFGLLICGKASGKGAPLCLGPRFSRLQCEDFLGGPLSI